ncbi:MAG TPA: zinc ribbon domain-containing protein [Thermomicrobiales bacterium]|nr:zinc ribbon domain-containing protein [Thermomicrobiales bacterium]
MEAIVARTLQVLLALSGAYLVALWFVLVVWTYRDIEARSRSFITQIFSTLLVVLFYVPGVLLYMILRPKETLDAAFQQSLEEEYLLQDLEELPLCPSCERYVEDDFLLCPHCHAQLREPCVACARLIDLRWSMCPYCGEAQGGKRVAAPEKVEAPAARWVAPALRRRTPELDAVSARERVAAAAAAELAAAPEIVPVPETATALTVVSPDGEASSIRPFDRRRTRAAAGRRTIGVNGKASANETQNGHPSTNGHHELAATDLITGNGNGNGNGHALAADIPPADEETADEPVMVGQSRSR